MGDTGLYIGLILTALIIIGVILWGINKLARKIAAREDINALGQAEARLKGEMAQLRQDIGIQSNELRNTLMQQIMSFGKNNEERLDAVRKTVDERLLQLGEANDNRFEQLRRTVDERLQQIQKNNDDKLELMRKTVDEKLHDTLEKRLGESFSQVSQRLEKVHAGLGEMQALASNVGDLKMVLKNVKTRGNWGEVQLGSLLEEILAPSQYGCNIAVNPNAPTRRVDYAIRLPGSEEGHPLYLPIDAKFPLEDYELLIQAQNNADIAGIQTASKELEKRIKTFAKDVREKYLQPPFTTDFAIIFVPLEGLYAELIRRPGLQEQLQREYRIVLAGPTTLAALLNSLQMGFRTLAVKERSAEVWQLLSAVKTGFGEFGELLSKTQKKLQEASNSIDKAAQKTRGIHRKLKNISELPAEEALPLLNWDDEESDENSRDKEAFDEE